ncbi:MAG: FAD-dependent oxidoreductase [Deltaproteobacteria bacterium]|nr:FAD-dependent oxidoreductase [Deltaproteobacteria bacterium]
MAALERLFSPIKIGKMEVKNRIAMAPMTTNWAPPDGTVPDRMLEYLEARAQGGVGLIIFETVTVDERFPYIMNSVGLWDDELIPGFKKFVDAMHAHGAKVAPQISHPGPESFSFTKGIQPVGPSPALNKLTGQVCRELAVEEIGPIVEQYGEAARRAREAGCDAMELHAAHNYMLAGSFLSPLRNRRMDDYGGTIDGRLRFVLEVMESIKRRAGSDFPVILRISGDEYAAGGRDLGETLYMAPKLVEAGVDAFEVSGGVQPELTWRIIPPMGSPRGLNVSAAAAIKQVVDVPVMVVGRINNPRMAEDVLQKGYADMIVMGRALLADPELPNKAAEGSFDDIAPCTGCTLGCVGEQMKMRSMTCSINPSVGREKEMVMLPAGSPKKVLVVGGGPGGMEAARVAAVRGHDVTLCEKEKELGGQLKVAAMAPMKQEISLWVRYLARQVKKVGVRVELNTSMTSDLIEQRKPDVVILATGSQCCAPPIPGVDKAKVACSCEIFRQEVVPKRSNVLVVGGSSVGCEVADAMAGFGDNPLDVDNRVTIIERLPGVAEDEMPGARMLLRQRLRDKGVTTITGATVREITDDGAVIEKNGEQQEVSGMDHIVLACGARAVEDLSEKIRDKVPEVHVIGDAKQPRRALEAIAEGAAVGRAV